MALVTPTLFTARKVYKKCGICRPTKISLQNRRPGLIVYGGLVMYIYSANIVKFAKSRKYFTSEKRRLLLFFFSMEWRRSLYGFIWFLKWSLHFCTLLK